LPLKELGVFRFFCTQAFGLLIEQGVMLIFKKLHRSEEGKRRPSVLVRLLGFVWVAAFMTWSGPAWLYPQAAKVQSQVGTSFLPFSIVEQLLKVA
jgi:hypothetical protein